MAQETPGSAFGMPAEDHQSSGLFDEANPEAPPQEPAPPAPEKGTTERPYAPPEEPPPEEETTPEEKLYAGVFKDVPGLEKGYEEVRRAFTERSMEMSELRAKQQEQEQILTLVAPLIQERLVAENPELAEQLEFAQRVQPMIDERLAPLQQEAETAQAQQEFLRTVTDFRARHPDVPPNSEADHMLAQVVQELDLIKEDPEALEVAYEASRDPALRFVLNASPHLADTDNGMAMARVQASQVAAQQSAQAPPGGTTQGEPARIAPRIPFVERGGSGAPTQGAPGNTPDSPLKEAIAMYRAERESPFLR